MANTFPSAPYEGRDPFLLELGGWVSRGLNLAWRWGGNPAGDSAVTFSAASWSLLLEGQLQGRLRVRLIDGAFRLFGGEKGHCFENWLWHRQRNLVPPPPLPRDFTSSDETETPKMVLVP